MSVSITDKVATLGSMSERRKFLLNKQVQERLELEARRVLDHTWNQGLGYLDGAGSGVVALGLACMDGARAWSWFEHGLEALETNPNQAPGGYQALTGGLLGMLSKRDSDTQRAREAIRQFLPRVQALHSHWYRQFDPEEDGLLSCEGIQAPLPNSLLIWSNECLIDMGRRQKLDVSECVEWNELSIYSMNEQLWSEERGLYDAFQVQTGAQIPCETTAGLVPLLGPIPSQEQAERMAQTLCSPGFWGTEEQPLYCLPSLRADSAGFRADAADFGAVSPHLNWLIWRGLQRYELKSLAKQVRLDSLELMANYGFSISYDVRRRADVPVAHERGKEAIAAALCLDFLAAKV